MSNKDKILFARENKILKHEKCGVGDTRVSVYVDGVKDPVYVGKNKVVVSGSAFAMAKFLNKSPKIWLPSYNSELQLDNSEYITYEQEGLRREEEIILFAVGNTGVYKNSSNSGVQPVPYVARINPEDLIPFKYQALTNDIIEEDKDKYFGRKTTSDRFIYYFKKPESISDIMQQYTDGTPIDKDVYINDRDDEVESFVRLTLKITKDDLRGYFENVSIDKAVSSISLLTGYSTIKQDENGVDRTYYQNIRPLTLYYFGEEKLVDPDKGITILYDLFF